MKKSYITFLLFSIICNPVMAGQSELERIRSQHQLPALAAALITGVTSYFYISGVRKWNNPAPARITDKFHLGSDTKAMTATLLAIFIERGRLKWDSTLEGIFPEFAAGMNTELKKVRVEMLGAHRSGIIGNITKTDLWDKTLDPVRGRKLATQELLSNPTDYAPGSKYEYSNANYIIIGAILEKLSGKSWETLMSEELFKPLKMNSCGFGAQANPKADPPDQPWPHQYTSSGPVSVTPDFFGDNPPILGPAGTVHCSLEDWGKFAKVHIDGFNGIGASILKPESFKKLHEDYMGQGYTRGAWGRIERSWAGGPALSHNGSNSMNYATIWLAPKKNAILMSATNAGGAEAEKATSEAIVLLVKELNK